MIPACTVWAPGLIGTVWAKCSRSGTYVTEVQAAITRWFCVQRQRALLRSCQIEERAPEWSASRGPIGRSCGWCDNVLSWHGGITYPGTELMPRNPVIFQRWAPSECNYRNNSLMLLLRLILKSNLSVSIDCFGILAKCLPPKNLFSEGLRRNVPNWHCESSCCGQASFRYWNT